MEMTGSSGLPPREGRWTGLCHDGRGAGQGRMQMVGAGRSCCVAEGGKGNDNKGMQGACCFFLGHHNGRAAAEFGRKRQRAAAAAGLQLGERNRGGVLPCDWWEGLCADVNSRAGTGGSYGMQHGDGGLQLRGRES